jgi:hypothetical protein
VKNKSIIVIPNPIIVARIFTRMDWFFLIPYILDWTFFKFINSNKGIINIKTRAIVAMTSSVNKSVLEIKPNDNMKMRV